METDLTALPNIGKALANELTKVGIDSPDALREVGSIQATARIAAGGRDACYSLLFALEGAIRGIRWHTIPRSERATLKARFDGVRAGPGG